MKLDIKDRGDVIRLVDTFYARARRDDLLKKIFLQVYGEASHKEILYKYWEDVLLTDPTAEHQNFPRHIELMLTPQYFIRWLTLFLKTIDNLYAGPNAEKAKVMVIRKSEEFQASLKIYRF